jgi:hypothetical protein
MKLMRQERTDRLVGSLYDRCAGKRNVIFRSLEDGAYFFFFVERAPILAIRALISFRTSVAGNG